MHKISAADYIVKILQKLNIEKVFGLPGDFNFEIVEAIEKNQFVNWVGSTNELNAGYAADGYARIKGFGALVTTYGVGELSAINAICGSMAENVPVVKIAGIPSTKNIKNKTRLHHNLVNVDYEAFKRAYSNTTSYCTILTKKNIKKEIQKAFNILVKN